MSSEGGSDSTTTCIPGATYVPGTPSHASGSAAGDPAVYAGTSGRNAAGHAAHAVSAQSIAIADPGPADAVTIADPGSANALANTSIAGSKSMSAGYGRNAINVPANAGICGGTLGRMSLSSQKED